VPHRTAHSSSSIWTCASSSPCMHACMAWARSIAGSWWPWPSFGERERYIHTIRSNQSIRACMHATWVALNIMDIRSNQSIRLHVAMWWSSARSKIHSLFYIYKRIRIYIWYMMMVQYTWLAGLPFSFTQWPFWPWRARHYIYSSSASTHRITKIVSPSDS